MRLTLLLPSDVMYRSQFQNPNSRQTQRLIQLNAIRTQLIMRTASTLSGLTMSDAMNALLDNILMDITSSDLSKLKALIGEWDEVKAQREAPQIEEKKDEEQGVDVQNVVNGNGDSEVANHKNNDIPSDDKKKIDAEPGTFYILYMNFWRQCSICCVVYDYNHVFSFLIFR